MQENGCGTNLGIIFGMLLDLIVESKIGITGILLGIVGYTGGYLDKNFSKDSKLTLILITIGATFVYEILSYLSIIIFKGAVIEILPFIKKVAIEILYNTIIVIVVYPLMQKTGYGIESLFKGNNILTRYF